MMLYRHGNVAKGVCGLVRVVGWAMGLIGCGIGHRAFFQSIDRIRRANSSHFDALFRLLRKIERDLAQTLQTAHR